MKEANGQCFKAKVLLPLKSHLNCNCRLLCYQRKLAMILTILNFLHLEPMQISTYQIQLWVNANQNTVKNSFWHLACQVDSRSVSNGVVSFVEFQNLGSIWHQNLQEYFVLVFKWVGLMLYINLFHGVVLLAFKFH